MSESTWVEGEHHLTDLLADLNLIWLLKIIHISTYWSTNASLLVTNGTTHSTTSRGQFVKESAGLKDRVAMTFPHKFEELFSYVAKDTTQHITVVCYNNVDCLEFHHIITKDKVNWFSRLGQRMFSVWLFAKESAGRTDQISEFYTFGFFCFFPMYLHCCLWLWKK